MRSYCTSLALLAAFAIPASAFASVVATDTITITGGGNTLVFSVPSNPIPDSSTPDGYFTLVNVPVTYNGAANTDTLTFFTTDDFGGFQDALIGDPFSTVLFVNDVSNPTFSPGNYAYSDTLGGETDGYVDIVGAPAPEPSALMLFGTGALGMAGMLRRRLRG